MDFSAAQGCAGAAAKLGADPPPHLLCGKGLQRRMAGKDAVLCSDIYDSRYQVQYINKTYRRTGTLWDSRYTSSRVQVDR